MNPVILITGASTGIGYATADLLAAQGYQVYATYRDPLQAKKLELLSEKKKNITILSLDVTSDISVQEAVRIIFEREKRLDVVINNAGFGIFGTSEMHTIKEIKKIFDVNVIGVIRVNQAVIPIMRKQPLGGRIINIGSLAGSKPSGRLSIYSTSKAALDFLTASDKACLEPHIKVSLIQPGPVVTNFKSKTPFGTKFQGKENPYQKELQNIKIDWNKVMNSGQSAYEVAKLIHEVIETKNPHLWYQTSLDVQEKMGTIFKDLTGNNRIPAWSKL